MLTEFTDYTACSGEGCPIKENCYRFTGPREPLWQSYFVEVPGEWEVEIDPIGGGLEREVRTWKCDMFWGETQHSIMEQLKDIVK